MCSVVCSWVVAINVQNVSCWKHDCNIGIVVTYYMCCYFLWFLLLNTCHNCAKYSLPEYKLLCCLLLWSIVGIVGMHNSEKYSLPEYKYLLCIIMEYCLNSWDA